MAEKTNEVSSVLAINGSPKGPEGITDMVVQRFLAGAEAAGAVTETAYPGKMKIAPCIGCLDCWFKTPHVCRHKDDMQGLIEKLFETEMLVLASPVYVDNMTSQMKKFFDRLCSVSEPFVEFKDGRSYHPPIGRENPKVVLISTCGFPEREHFEPISLSLRRTSENMHAEILSEFYFPGSMLFFTEPDLVKTQLEAVEKAGSEAVSEGRISPETIDAANRDYIENPEAFDEQLNELFHNLRRKSGAE